MAVSVYDRETAPSINALKTTKQKDLWLLVVVIASSLASIAATVYYYINGDILHLSIDSAIWKYLLAYLECKTFW